LPSPRLQRNTPDLELLVVFSSGPLQKQPKQKQPKK
jgi:hypothetical protein